MTSLNVTGSDLKRKVAGEEDVMGMNKKAKTLERLEGRERRLEQNRRAARASRGRKKLMVEELQRSVIFFSRSNGALRQENDLLERQLMQAQQRVAAIQGQQEAAAVAAAAAAATTTQPLAEPASEQAEAADVKAGPQPADQATADASAAAGKDEPECEVEQKEASSQQEAQLEQARADAVATQALYAMQHGFPNASARAVANAVNGAPATAAAATPTPPPSAAPALLNMKPGSTMQAMSDFQQAAAIAMQSALVRQQQVMGLSAAAPPIPQPTATPNPVAAAANPFRLVGGDLQKEYADTMTALALQQAAAMQYYQPLLQLQQQQQQQQQQPFVLPQPGNNGQNTDDVKK